MGGSAKSRKRVADCDSTDRGQSRADRECGRPPVGNTGANPSNGTPVTRRLHFLALVSAAAVLSACGGGGGGSGGGSAVANRAPTISGSPGTTVNAGTAYSFHPSASDPDGDPLTFSVQGKPAWLQFDTANGTLSGTPAAVHVGTHSGITITASDGKTSTSLASFSITVVDVGAPQISGTPPARTTIGQIYSFTPQASDPDGDDISFSVRNLPSWARFDPVLGRVYGTPPTGSEGAYSGIRISVSDDDHTVSLPAFSIAVEATSGGRATVSWAAPTQNADGSALTNLAGYLVFYGQSGADLVQVRTVNGVGTTSLVIDNLASGTWYFQMSAFNADNIESSRTPVVSRTIS